MNEEYFIYSAVMIQEESILDTVAFYQLHIDCDFISFLRCVQNSSMDVDRKDSERSVKRGVEIGQPHRC